MRTVRAHCLRGPSAATIRADRLRAGIAWTDRSNSEPPSIRATENEITLPSALVIHELYRFWRVGKFVALLAGAHAPGYSARNWQVEGQWAKARRPLKGQALGHNAGIDADEDKSEDALKAITESGIDDYVQLLQG